MKAQKFIDFDLTELDHQEVSSINGGDALMYGSASDALDRQARMVGFFVGFFSALFE
jgi:hypothetical protein